VLRSLTLSFGHGSDRREEADYEGSSLLPPLLEGEVHVPYQCDFEMLASHLSSHAIRTRINPYR
jgi:hypothetical protein